MSVDSSPPHYELLEGVALDQEIARLSAALRAHIDAASSLPALPPREPRGKGSRPLPEGFGEMCSDYPDWLLINAQRRKALLEAGLPPVQHRMGITIKLQPENLGGLLIFKFYDALSYSGRAMYDARFMAEPEKYPIVRALLDPDRTVRQWKRARQKSGNPWVASPPRTAEEEAISAQEYERQRRLWREASQRGSKRNERLAVNALVDDIRSMDIEAMTPLEALNHLARLKGMTDKLHELQA